ncbi:hypothetical protein [Nocardia barduliensis]|uniref:hypothetical protein n=1 Tax=Nocardia barduliensis TaxID=2736643 RepID=UPI00157190B8|nr:hypothetical protein [Nocardia barduliensis]
MAMIEHLRAEYNSYTAGAERFMWVAIRLAYSKYLVTDSDDPIIRLCFERQNLYLRGWTIERDWSFMAAWSGEERTGWTENQLGKLPPRALYRGGRARGPHIPSEYGGVAADPALNLEIFFRSLDVLYNYLSRLVQRPQQLADGIDGATAAFHLVARMTSEMARFDLFCQKFRDNLEGGIAQTLRLDSAFEWGDGQRKTPPFADVVTDWQNYTKKAAGGADSLQWQGAQVSEGQAAEVLGVAGARWRP